MQYYIQFNYNYIYNLLQLHRYNYNMMIHCISILITILWYNNDFEFQRNIKISNQIYVARARNLCTKISSVK